MLLRKPTMNLGACIGLTGNLTNHRLISGDDNYNMISQNIDETFYDKKNYRWIIECLDGGYNISQDFIEYMQDNVDLHKDFISKLNAYSNKWRSKLRHQSTLSSYHTTKHAQIQTVRSREKLAELIQSRCDAIQQVISDYKEKVNEMYLSERFGTIHKHYRSDAMNKLFKIARSSLVKVSNELKILRENEKIAQTALSEADIQFQNLKLNETKNEKERKVTRALDRQDSKQRKLKSIQRQIARKEEEYEQEREIYREKATEIYEQCRVLEQERLDQIRETLIKYIEAIHSSEYSNQQNKMHQELLSNIDSKQNSIEDLDFWARIYHITRSTEDTNETIDEDTNETIDEDTNETIDEDVNESVIQTEEEQLTNNTTTASSRTRPKKKKNSTIESATSDTS